ncbi:SusD/RagB family nutrient-binding outer membrane lipoprotein [Hymenobacter sp. BT559]|uniref:SusD/RagB family nutrient-binding outer membrane lipoprotein n=1 Tax=Hymenobacter sp. BT559 TaxID=2795729 RepID=UPI0018EA8813|nr:SusD/RagB family nutrient-binding outer membrane lipoprotein [Hymenobacter sp. BT559]MBJ6145217.1 SusD/RagB family nutrient-binding outer membrane lipoprotein [Hymenobacter sp. BT559]
MKKLLVLGASALAFTTSCVSNLSDDYNTNPKSSTSAIASGLISNAERTLVRTVNSSSVNLNPLRFYVQYWAATDYPNESQYDLITRSIPNAVWNALYRDCLRDLREAKNTIPNDITIPDASKANALAVEEVLEVYTWATLVETFGNIPYSQALDFNNSQPKYDSQATIYADLATRLDAAIGKFDASQPLGFGANELLFPGTTAAATTGQWIKFANALKLRMALVTADVDAAKSKTMAEATVGKLPTSNSDAVDLTFNGAPPNTNPLFEDLVRSGRTDFVGANIFINSLKGTAGPSTGVTDPRLDDYFNAATSTNVPAGTYAGGVVGTGNSKTNFSQPGSKLRAATLPGVLISYAEVELLQAEAIERGFNMGGTAESHYNAGVTASILEWGGTAADASTYLASNKVAYTTAPGDYKQKIGYQLWVALYNQPTESWTQWRRLDYPQLPLASNAIYPVIPRRYLYPTVEQNLNNANYAEASAALGSTGDNVATKLFWDKF